MNNHEETFEKLITVKHRPKKASALSASTTFAWRALLRIRYVPEQLFDVTVFPIIFLLMFTFVVDAVRGLIHGTNAINDIMMVIYISVGLILIFGPLTMYFFKNKE